MTELNPPTKKRKQGRTTQAQYELYVEALETNSHFRENKITPDMPYVLTNAWNKLVIDLNASGGPQKTIAEWKRVFSDWKSQVRKRVRTISNSLKETGNVGESERELTDLEQRLLNVTGKIVTEGILGVPEIGLNNELKIQNASKAEEKELAKELPIKKIKSSNLTEQKVLTEINRNLEMLVELKKQELQMRQEQFQLKMQVKYDFQITQEESEDIQDEINN